MKIKVKKLKKGATIPTIAHPGDAGMDLYTIDPILIKPGERTFVEHGIAVEIPEGHFGLVRLRSGLSSKHGLVLATSGVIDAGYRGEIKTCMTLVGKEIVFIPPNTRVAQMVIIPIPQIEVEEAEELSESSRGENGHGSTGA